MASRRGLSCPVPACRPKNKTSLRERAAQAFCCGTGGGTRTHIPVRIPDFESSASANSATPASGFERNVYRSIALVKRDAPLFFSLPSLPSLLFFFFLFVTLVTLVTFFLFFTLVTLVTLVAFFLFSFRHSRFSRHFFSFLHSLHSRCSRCFFSFFFSSLSSLSFLSSLFSFRHFFLFRCSRYLLSLFLPDGEGAVGTGAPSLRCWAQGSWATPRFATGRRAPVFFFVALVTYFRIFARRRGHRRDRRPFASLRGAWLLGNASLRCVARGFRAMPRFATGRRAFRTLSK